MSAYWLWFGVAVASPEFTVESASLQLPSGASVTVESANISDGQISGTGVDVDNGTLTIRADSTQVSIDGDHGVFEGNVRAERGDLSFSAKRVDVDFGPNGDILKATAQGRVTVQQGDREAVGETAVFREGRLVLSGRPVVRQGPNEMTGEEIVFVVGQRTIECIQCTMKVQGALRP